MTRFPKSDQSRKMSRYALLMTVSAFVLCAFAPVAHAQEDPDQDYSRGHFYMGAGAAVAAVLNESGPHGFLNTGGGFDLFIGGRLSRRLALELGWQPTFHKNDQDIFGSPTTYIGLHAVTLDLKVFLARGPVQPYFTIGGGVYVLGNPFNPISDGPGWQIGGGIDFWLSRSVSLGFKLQYRGVELYDYDRYNENTYLSFFNGELNIAVHF